MIPILRRIATSLILLVYDVGVHLWEMPRVLFLRTRDYSGLFNELEAKETRRLAIIAPHPTQILKFTLSNLIKGLQANGYEVVVLVHDEQKVPWIKENFPGVHLAGRHKAGRDFGAWKEVLLGLFDRPKLMSSIESLIIVNDSLYFNEKTGK